MFRLLLVDVGLVKNEIMNNLGQREKMQSIDEIVIKGIANKDNVVKS